MKKIFYIVLVIVALMVISRFVKQGNQTVPSEVIAVEEVVPEGAEAAEAVSEEVAVDENGNPIAEEETVSEAEAVSVEEAADPRKKRRPTPFPPNKPVKNCYKKVIIFDDLFYCISKKNSYIST